MTRNTALLADLTRENGGVGFWALIEDERLICLNTVVADSSVDPGFSPGQALVLGETFIPAALRRRDPGFVAEADGTRSTVMVPIRSPRGHDLGWVGLTLPGARNLPPAPVIRLRVETLAAEL